MPPKKSTPFFKFMSEERPKIKAEHPDWKPTEVAKECGKRWRELSDTEKEAFK